MADKLSFVPCTDDEEHLARHTDSSSLVVGSKVVAGTSRKDVQTILKKFDAAYQEAIEKEGNPGRRVFALETSKPVGTDAIVPAETLQSDRIFNIVREPQTCGEANIKVALISPEDMPKTNIVHGICGPYDPTGQGGIYTMIYGDVGEPFPESAQTPEMKARAEEYWNGKDGKSGHVFPITPDELDFVIGKMKEAGLDTKTAEAHRKAFERKPNSPVLTPSKSSPEKEAVNLGKVSLSSGLQNQLMSLQKKSASKMLINKRINNGSER